MLQNAFVQPLTEVPLAAKTSLGVGGNARFFFRANDEAELQNAVRWARQNEESVKVLGGGSNVVIADEGFEGLVLQVGMLGTRVVENSPAEIEVEVAAGESWHDFVMRQVRLDRQGVECLAGIPGLVGATPLQNVGAYGQEVCESIVEVKALEISTGRFRVFDRAALRFAYRDSFFKREVPDEFIISRVRFRLRPGAAPVLRYGELSKAAEALRERDAGTELGLLDVARLVVELRKAKSMVLDPSDENGRSCGSFFLNPIVSRAAYRELAAEVPDIVSYPQADGRVKLPAAWLIEHAGLGKGTRRGTVGLSTRHTLALVCHEGATARDVVRFALEVQQTVRERFGIQLDPEPVFWGFADKASLPRLSA